MSGDAGRDPIGVQRLAADEKECDVAAIDLGLLRYDLCECSSMTLAELRAAGACVCDLEQGGAPMAKYDAYWCPACDVWLSKVCSDPNCGFCANRPAKPSMVDDPSTGDEPAIA